MNFHLRQTNHLKDYGDIWRGCFPGPENAALKVRLKFQPCREKLPLLMCTFQCYGQAAVETGRYVDRNRIAIKPA